MAWARTGGRWTRVWLAVLAGLAGGAAILAVAGWSRTRGALPAFEHFAPPADAAVSDDSPAPGDPLVLEQIVKAAGADASLIIANVAVALYRPDGTATAIGAVASPVPSVGTLDRGRFVAGGPPDPGRPDELTMNEVAAADLDVHVGSTIDVGLFAPLQGGQNAPGEPVPGLGRIPMTVTGIVRYTADLEHQPNAVPGTDFATADERVSLGDGFWPAYGSRVAVDFLGVAVRLPDGAAGFSRLANVTTDLSGGRFNSSLGDNFIPNRAALVRTIDLQAGALLAVGLLAALAGAVLLAQAVIRPVAARAADHRILAGLGMTRRQIVASEVLAVVPAAIGGVVLAAVVAVGLSPVTPVGVARAAELHPGLDVNWVVVSVGALVIVAAILTITALAAWGAARRRSGPVARRSWLPARLAAVGAPPAVVAGSDFALSRQGRLGAVRPALAALAVGVIVVVGAWVVHGSLSALLDSPTDRGWAWDAQVGRITSEDGAAAAAQALDRDPDVAGYTGQLGGVFVPIDGHPTPITVLDPHGAVSGPIVLDGRAPSGADEIGLGAQTLAALRKHVGDVVTVGSPQGQVVQLRVVGTIVPMSAVDSLESFGDGALVPLATAQQTSGPDQPLVPSDYLVTFRQGIDRSAALSRLEHLFPRTVLVAPTSVDVDTLRRVDWLPVALAGLVALLTIGTLAHVMVTSVRRRRRDFGVLRAVGFTGGQLRTVVVAMAVVVALVVLAIGVPLGLAAGRVAWRIIADGLGTEASPDLPPWLLVVVPVTIGLAVLTALVPAWRTVRRGPAEALRRE
jgi:FtsX-like permease family